MKNSGITVVASTPSFRLIERFGTLIMVHL